jgi:serine/threonine protein phosphatase PrpC
MPLPAIEIAQKTDPGRDPEKQLNEDSLGYEETRFGHLCVVADGMGGHEGGKEASILALESILEHFRAASDDSRPADVLRDALTLANQRVFGMAGGISHHARPGSTVVALLVHEDGAEVAHVGDSRAYQVHGTQIFQVTKDHSMVQKLVDAGFLTPAQAAVHPNANQITRALGMQHDVEVEVREQPLFFAAGDVFVLCSDGLSDLVESQEILTIVGSAPPAQAAGQLIDLANARGGHDNISAIVIRTKGSAKGQPAALPPTVVGTLAPSSITAEETLPAVTVARGAHATENLQGAPPIPASGIPAPPAPQSGSPTLVQAPVPAAMSSTPHVTIPRAPAPVDHEPPSSHDGSTTGLLRAARRGRGLAPSALIGILLAVVGVAIALALLVMHMTDRAGKRKEAPFPLTTDVPVDASTE